MKKRYGKQWFLWLPFVLPALLCCYPIVFMITGMVMNKVELRTYLGPAMQGGEGYVTWRVLPLYPTLRNVIELLIDSPGFFVMFWNSLKMTLAILAGQLLVGVPAAWGLARYEFPFQRAVYTVYVVLMMMPFQVLMLSEYLVLDQFRLLNTQWAVIVPAVFSTFPVFIMYRFFCSVPEAIVESARLDGAGDWKLFWLIGLPLGTGGIVSSMVLGFLEYWNLVEQPLTFLKDKSQWPLALFLPNISLEQAGGAFAASVVTLLPAILIFLAGQDYLEKGIVAAAVKE